MNVTDNVCGFECIKEGSNVHDFTGPVRVILVDPPADQYWFRKSGGAFIAAATMMIGANSAIMLLFAFGFKVGKFINFHIVLCTFGFQFCMPLAILMMNPLYGAAGPLNKLDKRREHFGLQIMALMCYFSGSLIAMSSGEPSAVDPPESNSSAHFVFGLLAFVFGGLNIFLGACLIWLNSTILKTIHRTFGILAFMSSSVCFVLGIVKPTMQIWLYIVGYMAPTYMIVFFTAFYTLAVVADPMSHIVSKIYETIY